MEVFALIVGNPAPRRRKDLVRALAAGCMFLLMALSGRTADARDRLTGDVQRIEMIGFTVTDVDREADFFVTVLQFEKVADFRAVGSEFDKLEGVFNASLRIVHLKLGDQMVAVSPLTSATAQAAPTDACIWYGCL